MFQKFIFDEQRMRLHIDKLDNQHLKLIDLMNLLGEKNDQKAKKDELMKIFNQLQEVTVNHFKEEEEYFSKLPGYDQVDVHKQIHKTLLEKFMTHKNNFQNGTSEQLGSEIFDFLKMWLAAHICGIDSKYGAIANKK